MANYYDPNPTYCATCGTETEPDARFCPNCGAVTDPQGSGGPANAPGMPYYEQAGQAGIEYMGFWIRVAASLIDIILLIIVTIPLQFVAGGSLVLNLVFTLGYYVVFTAWRGQTLGKMALGIQVVDRQGNVPNLGQVLLREVVGKILSSIALGLGYLWVAWDKEKRGWHDHIGGTYVVRKQRGN